MRFKSYEHFHVKTSTSQNDAEQTLVTTLQTSSQADYCKNHEFNDASIKLGMYFCQGIYFSRNILATQKNQNGGQFSSLPPFPEGKYSFHHKSRHNWPILKMFLP